MKFVMSAMRRWTTSFWNSCRRNDAERRAVQPMQKTHFEFAARGDRPRAGCAFVSVVALFACGLVLATQARADQWPSRPITLVVPYAAGGNVDIAARIFARVLSD